MPADTVSYGNVETARRPRQRRALRVPGPAKIGGFLLAGVLVGGAVAFAAQHHPSAAANNTNAASGRLGAGTGTTGGSAGSVGGFGGGLPGEQHIFGTVTAKSGSTITVRSGSSTQTYGVIGATEIVRNGFSAALSAVKVGDPVFVHVYPSGGKMLVERLFAGTSADSGGIVWPGSGVRAGGIRADA
jgi:hypothetical protein